MKGFKIVIILLVVVAIASGATYCFTRSKANGSIEISGSTVKETTVEKNIKDKIENASNSAFSSKAYEDILKQINLFFEEEPTNKQTYTLMLQGAYTRKFCQQANYVFDGNNWSSSDISTIRKELARCKKFSPDDSDLKTIENILNNYDKLISYNQKVANACSQQPKCVRNSYHIYIDDDWDIQETNELLSSIPTVSGKVINSPLYNNTRKSEVEKRLRKAHKQFIEIKMNCAEKEAKGYNYNNARHGDWMIMGNKLYDNFKTYYSKWGEDTSTWQTRVASWEQYTIPNNNDF